MHYNFDEIIDRQHTASVKYDLRKDIFSTEDVIPMWVADMDFRTPDFVIKAIKDRLQHEVLGYSFRPYSYFQSIVKWVKARHQWHIKEEWIAFAPGIVPAINLAVMAYTQAQDKIIVQPPVYFPFFSSINDNHRTQINNPLRLINGRYEIDFEDLVPKLKEAKMLILSNPHNPGGSVWRKAELQKLAHLCLENKVIILSDEIHSDLVFKPHTYTPIASLSAEIAQNTVSFIAPSKTFNMAGLATSSVICANPKLKAAYEKLLETLHIGMGNIFGAVASEAAYTQGEEWLDQLLAYLKNNINFLEAYLQTHIPQIKAIRPEGTYLVWLDCSALKMSGKMLNEFMIKKARIGFNDGRMFGKGGEHFMRINIACPQQYLAQALQQLEEAVNTLT